MQHITKDRLESGYMCSTLLKIMKDIFGIDHMDIKYIGC